MRIQVKRWDAGADEWINVEGLCATMAKAKEIVLRYRCASPSSHFALYIWYGSLTTGAPDDVAIVRQDTIQ